MFQSATLSGQCSTPTQFCSCARHLVFKVATSPSTNQLLCVFDDKRFQGGRWSNHQGNMQPKRGLNFHELVVNSWSMRFQCWESIRLVVFLYDVTTLTVAFFRRHRLKEWWKKSTQVETSSYRPVRNPWIFLLGRPCVKRSQQRGGKLAIPPSNLVCGTCSKPTCRLLDAQSGRTQDSEASDRSFGHWYTLHISNRPEDLQRTTRCLASWMLHAPAWLTELTGLVHLSFPLPQVIQLRCPIVS